MENKHWVSYEANIGNIRIHKKVVVNFQALPGVPKIIDFVAQCGCTKVNYDENSKKLAVTYKAGNIPKHISGNQPIAKKITVIYENEETEVLLIKGTKIR